MATRIVKKQKPLARKLVLHFNRSKIFHGEHNGAVRKYAGSIGKHGDVPLWVRGTVGYTMGVEDGSIVDLTPPVIAEQAPEPPEPLPLPAQNAVPDPDDEEDEDAEPEEKEKPAFGGQTQKPKNSTPTGLQSTTRVKK